MVNKIYYYCAASHRAIKIAYCPWAISGLTLYQRAHGSKFSRAPLVEVPRARVERRICTSFLGGLGMLMHAKIFESTVSEMQFPGLWGEILPNSDGQKTTL